MLRRAVNSWVAVAAAAVVFVGLVASATAYTLAHQPTAQNRPAQATPTPSISASTLTTPSPTATAVALGSAGRTATSDEFAAMVAVGKAPAERDLGLGDWSACASAQRCLRVRDGSGLIGVSAGTFQGDSGCPSGCGGSSCTVFLFLDPTGWHYVNAGCAQATGSLPGPNDTVRVTGCANVRDRPGFESSVLDCLPNGTTVNVDSAPAYVDGRLWWHLQGLGWMAHDFLVASTSVH